MGDICSAQVHALYERGVDVHLAVPDYKNVLIEKDLSGVDIHHRQHQLPENLIHLAHDPSFYTILNCFCRQIRMVYALPLHFSGR